MLGLILDPQYKFAARAAGPKGPFIAGESENIEGDPDQSDTEHVSVFNSLNTMLTSDGWEYAGMGENWWSYRYRRKAKGKLFGLF